MDGITVTYNNDVAILTIDIKDDKVNTLKAEFADIFKNKLQEIKAKNAKGLIIISGKDDNFIAGADISMLDNCQTFDSAHELSTNCQQIFNELNAMTIPVVAAINGSCLGGGLELALAAHMRIGTDNPKTILGLPEVQLGLLPGGGGTQRLIPLTGLIAGLDILLSGKRLSAKAALNLNILDQVVPNSILLDAAMDMVKKPIKAKNRALRRFLENNIIIRHLILKKVTKKITALTKGNYPAPIKIIETVRFGLENGIQKGFHMEADNFAELVLSSESKALRRIFFITTENKKPPKNLKPIKQVLVLGAGLMGSGIAAVTAKAKLPVRIKDVSEDSLNKALRYVKKVISFRKTETDINRTMALLTTSTDYLGAKSADFVVEAVYEDLNLKQQMISDIEDNCEINTIFASNTSSIPLHLIAAKAKRPENIIGLHYFSPVERMPLVEIIAHKETSQATIYAAVGFALKQGKTPILVQDRAGFYINRILAPYMNAAFSLLTEGYSIKNIDKALVDFGFPMGPITLLDSVGLDVVHKIGPILHKELGNKFAPNPLFEKLINDKRFGLKTNKGFYIYKDKKKLDDPNIYKLLGLKEPDLDKIPDASYCVLPLLNEALACLREGVIKSTADGDIGAIYGIGFPPFLGGPFNYINKLGIRNLYDKLNELTKEKGDHYAPDISLKIAVDTNKEQI